MRLHAIRVMANYHDPEVVAALKKHLHNTAVFEVRYRLPDRQRIAIGRYVWGEESPFEEPTGDVEIKRTFFMRLAAYESLRKMGIEVKRPRLSPD